MLCFLSNCGQTLRTFVLHAPMRYCQIYAHVLTKTILQAVVKTFSRPDTIIQIDDRIFFRPRFHFWASALHLNLHFQCWNGSISLFVVKWCKPMSLFKGSPYVRFLCEDGAPELVKFLRVLLIYVAGSSSILLFILFNYGVWFCQVLMFHVRFWFFM